MIEIRQEGDFYYLYKSGARVRTPEGYPFRFRSPAEADKASKHIEVYSSTKSNEHFGVLVSDDTEEEEQE